MEWSNGTDNATVIYSWARITVFFSASALSYQKCFTLSRKNHNMAYDEYLYRIFTREGIGDFSRYVHMALGTRKWTSNFFSCASLC